MTHGRMTEFVDMVFTVHRVQSNIIVKEGQDLEMLKINLRRHPLKHKLLFVDAN